MCIETVLSWLFWSDREQASLNKTPAHFVGQGLQPRHTNEEF